MDLKLVSEEVRLQDRRTIPGLYVLLGAYHESTRVNEYDLPHIAMTYTALCCLLILGDDFSRLHKKEIMNELAQNQLANGWCAFFSFALKR